MTDTGPAPEPEPRWVRWYNMTILVALVLAAAGMLVIGVLFAAGVLA